MGVANDLWVNVTHSLTSDKIQGAVSRRHSSRKVSAPTDDELFFNEAGASGYLKDAAKILGDVQILGCLGTCDWDSPSRPHLTCKVSNLVQPLVCAILYV